MGPERTEQNAGTEGAGFSRGDWVGLAIVWVVALALRVWHWDAIRVSDPFYELPALVDVELVGKACHTVARTHRLEQVLVAVVVEVPPCGPVGVG